MKGLFTCIFLFNFRDKLVRMIRFSYNWVCIEFKWRIPSISSKYARWSKTASPASPRIPTVMKPSLLLEIPEWEKVQLWHFFRAQRWLSAMTASNPFWIAPTMSSKLAMKNTHKHLCRTNLWFKILRSMTVLVSKITRESSMRSQTVSLCRDYWISTPKSR